MSSKGHLLAKRSALGDGIGALNARQPLLHPELYQI